MAVPVIVCIDDEKIVLDSLRDQMECRFGDTIAVECAESGEEAIDLIEELLSEGVEIPAVICDYVMPPMKGEKILSHIKSLNSQITCILLTGQATLDAVKKAVNSGIINRYMPKPWDKSVLYKTIEDILDKHSTHKEFNKRVETAKMLKEQLREKEDFLTGNISNSQDNVSQYVKSYIETTSINISSTLSTLFCNMESIRHLSSQLSKADEGGSHALKSFYNQTSQTLQMLLDAFATSCATSIGENITETDFGKHVNNSHGSTSVYESISSLMGRIDALEGQIKKKEMKIVAWDDEEMLVFSLNDILCFAAESKSTFTFTKKGKFRVKETLDSLEERLSNYYFFRCHRGFLINVNHITKITPWLGSNSYISKLEGIDFDIPISRTRVKDIKKILGVIN